MTTRKHAARYALVAALTGVALGEAGCATPGPLHVYSLPANDAANVADSEPGAGETPSTFLAPGETVTGFAYDPFTDHFFLRLAPGDAIRVVDRPARAIKREFKVSQLLATGGGDLAIRPRDGHVFAILPGDLSLAEFSRYGEFVGQVSLGRMAGLPRGVAYDSARDRLLVLAGEAPARIFVQRTNGRLDSVIALDRAATGDWLAFDSEQREFYVPLGGGAAVGVFGEDGKLRRQLPLQARALDVGPRSFLRMF